MKESMNIALAFRQHIRGERPVECYSRSFLRTLEEKGHSVTTCGEGHEVNFLGELDSKDFDCIIEIDNGRNKSGELLFQQSKVGWRIPSAVWLVDSHGHGNLHKHVSTSYNHVFFAPYIKRDLFTKHPSAHWCPNATDMKWFGRENLLDIQLNYDFVFVGSKNGLLRAEKLKDICNKRDWTCFVGQLSSSGKHMWPFCAQKIREGSIGFNWGQKGDSPNQRVMETMATGRVLLNDLCELDGMTQLFSEGVHYLGYHRDFFNLEDKMEYALRNPEACSKIAENAYKEVKANHTIENRVNQILEVLENAR